MGAVILKDIKEHAKYRKWKQSHIDPRNASRTPSASKEPLYRLRYESPIGASPSRHSDHQKPFYEDEPTFDRSTSYRGSVGRSIGNAPSYNGMLTNRSITNCYTFIILLFLLYFPYSFMFVCFFFLSNLFLYFHFQIQFQPYQRTNIMSNQICSCHEHTKSKICKQKFAPHTALHSYRSPPRHGLKTSTLPATIGYRNGYSSVSANIIPITIHNKHAKRGQL